MTRPTWKGRGSKPLPDPFPRLDLKRLNSKMTIFLKTASGRKAAERRRQQRDMLFPNAESIIWNRLEKKGFTTIPKTLPLFMRVMDHLSPHHPLADTYLELWCRTFDEAFIELDRTKEMAFGAGFASQRNVQTWGDRIDRLAKLGFIKLQAGPHGPRSYALIVNPYLVVIELEKQPEHGIPAELLNALKIRASNVGAEDFNPTPKSKPAPPLRRGPGALKRKAA